MRVTILAENKFCVFFFCTLWCGDEAVHVKHPDTILDSDFVTAAKQIGSPNNIIDVHLNIYDPISFNLGMMFDSTELYVFCLFIYLFFKNYY